MKEIERKFLVQQGIEKYLLKAKKYDIRQGYLQKNADCTVRIRLKNDIGYLTIKGKSKNFTRDEFEYEIPFEDANELLKLCGKNVLEKTRYELTIEKKKWEIDEFHGKLNGLWLAEIELENECENFNTPEWLGKEVSLDFNFSNSNLVAITDLKELNL